jgi:MFS family permease
LQIDSKDSLGKSRDIWKFAFVNAASHLSAALLYVSNRVAYMIKLFGKKIFSTLTLFEIRGSRVSGPLNDLLHGRRGAIFVAAVFCFTSVIGSAFVNDWRQLLACRILLGVGVGINAIIGRFRPNILSRSMPIGRY